MPLPQALDASTDEIFVGRVLLTGLRADYKGSGPPNMRVAPNKHCSMCEDIGAWVRAPFRRPARGVLLLFTGEAWPAVEGGDERFAAATSSAKQKRG